MFVVGGDNVIVIVIDNLSVNVFVIRTGIVFVNGVGVVGIASGSVIAVGIGVGIAIVSVSASLACCHCVVSALLGFVRGNLIGKDGVGSSSGNHVTGIVIATRIIACYRAWFLPMVLLLL